MKTARIGTIAAFAALAVACSGNSAYVPARMAGTAASRLPDSAPKSCPGQHTTKNYADVGFKPLSTKGGLLCVPSFGDWGGTMAYPNVTKSGMKARLIASTTEYSGPLWPPNGSVAPIFLLQFIANKNTIAFGKTIPKGGVLVGAGLKLKQPYSLQGILSAFGSLWENLGACYTVPFSTKSGPAITGFATTLAGKGFSAAGTRVIIEVVPGKFFSNHC